MGTRYEDQPPEHWAGPESHDPTPVWKQYLVVVLAAAYAALAVELATPPATLIGGRVVLSATDVPAIGAPARRFAVDPSHPFYLAQPRKGELVAVPAGPGAGAPVIAAADAPGGPPLTYDRYLVSVEGGKVVVNTSRVISGTEVVPAPSDPTFR